MAGLLDLILQKIPQSPAPALAPSAIDEEARARTSGLNSLVSDVQTSFVPEPKQGLTSNIIRAIANAVSVGTSQNPSEALARQLVQQQADVERRIARKQAQQDKVFQAKTIVTKARQDAADEIRKELQTDKTLLAKQRADEKELQQRQQFQVELANFKIDADARAATLGSERAQILERLRQKDNITATSSLNTMKLLGEGVDAQFIPSISDKILNQQPFSPEEQKAIDEARSRRDKLKLAQASIRTSGAEKLTLPRIAALHRAFFEIERSKKVPAFYEDPKVNPKAEFPADPTNPEKQPGKPVTQGLFRMPVFRNLDAEATQKAFEYAQGLALASEDPEVIRRTKEFLGAPRIDLTSLGPLAAKAERIMALQKSKNYNKAQTIQAIDTLEGVSPSEIDKLKAFFNNLP